MPRIEADNIEEHVRRQTQRILDAASALFASQGYRRTEMRDIAAAVGLRRNSLYRYFPNKDHILLASLKRDMQPYLEQLRALEQRYPDARQRLDAWLELQMEIAATACHGMLHMANEIRENSPELRREILALHEPPNVVLQQAVAELLAGSGRDATLVADMVASMLRSAAAAMLAGAARSAVMAELKRSVARVIQD